MANKKMGVLLICLLCGLTIGYFIGELCEPIKYLRWCNKPGIFGLDEPLQLNLGVIWFSFQIKLKITVASIIGMLLGIVLYKKI